MFLHFLHDHNNSTGAVQPLAGGSRVEVVQTEVSQGSDFESWVAAREGSLQRLALLLTGSPDQAQDLTQTTLAKLYLAWDRLDDRHQLDAALPEDPR